MFDLIEKRRWLPVPPVPSAGRSPVRFMVAGADVALSGTRESALKRLQMNWANVPSCRADLSDAARRRLDRQATMRWAGSTSWSTTPASPETILRCA